MKLTPYILLNGNCKEALAFYEKALNGEILKQQTFGEAPSGDLQKLEEAKDLILHGLLEFDGGRIMFSDAYPSEPAPTESFISLAISLYSVEQVKNVFNALKEGGSVLIELSETFWTKCYGMVVDKFGIQWQIDYEEKE